MSNLPTNLNLPQLVVKFITRLKDSLQGSLVYSVYDSTGRINDCHYILMYGSTEGPSMRAN